MIDTTDGAPTDTPKRTPMLKLGRKKLGMARTYNEEGEETKQPNNVIKMSTREKIIECPFRECGRKFVSEPELKNHMTRRHKPTASFESTPEPSSVVETTEASTIETPVPARGKVETTEKWTNPN